jgi:hypothetical protein
MYTASLSMVLYNEFDVVADDLLNGEDFTLLGWKKPTAKIKQGFRFWCEANLDNFKIVYENKIQDRSTDLKTELIKVKDELIERFLKIKNLELLNEDVEKQYRDLAMMVGQVEYLKWLYKTSTESTLAPDKNWDSDEIEAWSNDVETWVNNTIVNNKLEAEHIGRKSRNENKDGRAIALMFYYSTLTREESLTKNNIQTKASDYNLSSITLTKAYAEMSKSSIRLYPFAKTKKKNLNAANPAKASFEKSLILLEEKKYPKALAEARKEYKTFLERYNEGVNDDILE